MQTYSELHRNNRYGKVWRKVWKRDEGKCVLCLSEDDLTIDHVISVKMGGKSTLSNLRLLCRRCNTLVGQATRIVDPKLEKKRNYMREWAKKHPNYFAKKSREFRARNKGYHQKYNQEQYRLYREAQI